MNCVRCDYSQRLLLLDKLWWCFPAICATGQGALQGVFEGLAEIAIEVRVDQGIEGAVEVTYPE